MRVNDRSRGMWKESVDDDDDYLEKIASDEEPKRRWEKSGLE